MVAAKSNNNQSLTDFILTSPAPIETAAKLSSIFRHMAANEKARSRDLHAASDYCEEMAVDLLVLAAGQDSAAAVLRSIDCRGVSILDVLIECELKEVVSHEYVQKYLSQVNGTGSSKNASKRTCRYKYKPFPTEKMQSYCFIMLC
jgi:hypothetical protein